VEDSPFRDRIGVIRRHWVVVLAATVATVLAALFVSHLQQRLYQASATVLLNEQDPTLAAVVGSAATPPPSSPPDRYAATQAALARAGVIAQMAVSAAHVPGHTAAGLLAASSVGTNPSTDLLSFSVDDPNPAVAQKLATAYAKQFTRYRRRLDAAGTAAALSSVDQRLNDLQLAGDGGSALGHQLRATSRHLRELGALQQSGSSAVLVGRAGAPTVVQPRTTRNLALGLLAGLALGIALAFLRDGLDQRVRSDHELRERLGLPLLAHIPSAAPAKPLNRPATDPPGDLAPAADGLTEAFNILRTNLHIRRLQHEFSSIVITSAGESEGKSTTAANLAVALARAGRHVVLMDLDLRHPRIDRYFDIPLAGGLMDVAAGNLKLPTALMLIEVHPERSSSYDGVLEVLPAGFPPPEDPGEFLSSAFFATTLATLSQRCDVLLIDAPPMLAVGDAMAIAMRADALLLVVDVNTMTRDTLKEMRQALDDCPALTLGLVTLDTSNNAAHGHRRNGHRRWKLPNSNDRWASHVSRAS
jgi:capsular exopolysaccharide synthesis family protein